MTKILAGAVNAGRQVIKSESDGFKVTNVHTDPASGLITVTFAPALTNTMPIVTVTSATPHIAFVSDITNTAFVIGGTAVFHYVVVLPQ